MAIFSCTKCGHMHEQLVSNGYMKSILKRMVRCVRCEKPTYHHFVTHSGRVASPMETDGSMAAQYWRKQRYGKIASAPLDRVCGKDDW